MQSLYSQYIKEREGLEILEVENGFISYRIKDNWIYISDIFVNKDHRRTKLATELADSIIDKAINQGITKLYCQVDLKALNWEDSSNFIKAYGCIPCKYDNKNGIMYFEKTIG